MNRWLRLIVWAVIAVVIGLLVFGPYLVEAQSEVPDGVQVFHLDTGQTCVLYDDNGPHPPILECYCPCETGLCAIETEGLAPRPIPTEVRDGGTPEPSPVHTFTPNSTPTSTPEVEGTVTPEPQCNRGLGNGSEDCDPGNSGGKPGNAGEDNEDD